MSEHVTVPAREFAHALKAVLPHAEPKTGNVPALQTVHVVTRDGVLILEATDRYTLAESRVEFAPGSATDVEVDFNIPGERAKALISALRTAQLGDVLKFAPQSYGADMVTSTSREEFYRHDGYPAISRLWPADNEREPVGGLTINPAYFKKLDTANLARNREEKRLGVRLSFRANPDGSCKHVMAEFGDHFRALVMPMREAK